MKRLFAFALVTTATLARAQDGTGLVHVDGSASAVIEAYDFSYQWHPVCTAPCDRHLPYAFGYRIVGPDIQPSRPFALSSQSDAHLSVEAGSRGLHVFGIVLVPFSAAAVGTGLAFLVIGSLTYACSDCIEGLANTTMVNWGWGLVVGGIVGLVAGGALLAATRTNVKLWGDPIPYVRVSDIALREKSAAPRAFGSPLFAVSF